MNKLIIGAYIASLVTMIGTVVGLALIIGSSVTSVEAFGAALLVLASRFALIAAFLAMGVCWMHLRWGWFAALGVVSVIVLLSGPLSNLMGGSPAPYIASPFVASAVALASLLRTGAFRPARASTSPRA